MAAKSRFTDLPQLGVGLGYRPVHRGELFQHRSSIDFLEIVADHYFDPSPTKSAELALLENNFPLIPHGLALSVGSADGVNREYLANFASIVERTQPVWCSDHIAFTHAGGIDVGHLTPLPKTRASLRILKENIAIVKDSISVPLILENITETIQFPQAELSDAEFLCEICEQNDVGILLDVTNLYINSVNHGFDALTFLRGLPADRIVQLHFVGGHLEEGNWIDSHGAATQEEIWQLLREVLEYSPVKGIILERDENIPPLAELVPELDRARGMLQHCSV